MQKLWPEELGKKGNVSLQEIKYIIIFHVDETLRWSNFAIFVRVFADQVLFFLSHDHDRAFTLTAKLVLFWPLTSSFHLASLNCVEDGEGRGGEDFIPCWVLCTELRALHVVLAGTEVRSQAGRSRSNRRPIKSFRWSRVPSVGHRLAQGKVGFFSGWEAPGDPSAGDIQGAGDSAHPPGAAVGARRTCSGRVPSPTHDKAGEELGSKFPPGVKMITSFFPLKKLRRNGKYLLFGAILLAGLVAVYHEMVAAKEWRSDMSKFMVYDFQYAHCYSQSVTQTFADAPFRRSFYLW